MRHRDTWHRDTWRPDTWRPDTWRPDTWHRVCFSRPSEAKLILRSSTNVEDLEGFNGAGLYASEVVCRSTDLCRLYADLQSGLANVWYVQLAARSHSMM